MIPVIKTLQHVWPETRITWIIGKAEAALLDGFSGVEFVVFDKRGGWQSIRELKAAMKDRQFDVFLNMQAALRSNLLSLLIHSPIKLGFDKQRGRDWQWLFTNAKISGQQRVHVLDVFFQFLEKLGISERKMEWDFAIPQQARDFADSSFDIRPLLVINASSSVRKNNYRNWSASHYAAICDHAQNSLGMQIALTGGPADNEKQMSADICSTSSADITDLTGRTSLKQLTAVLAKAAAVIAPDTGPMHLAAALGRPVIGLFATSNPDRSGPYLQRDYIVNRYPEALLADTGKPVEAVKWGQRVRNPAAMDLISREEVQQKLQMIMDEKPVD